MNNRFGQRIGRLGQLLTEHQQALDKNSKLKIFEDLASYLKFLEQTKSELQFNEEYDAFLFVMAYIKRYCIPSSILSSITKPKAPDFHPQFQAFLYQLSQRQFSPDTYTMLLDWGFYIRENHRALILSQEKDFEKIFELSESAPKLTDLSEIFTGGRVKNQPYTWYVTQKQAEKDAELQDLGDKLQDEEDNYTWGTCLGFFVPGVFFATAGWPLIKEALEKKDLQKASLIGLGCFILLFMPPVSALFNYFICKDRVEAARDKMNQARSSSGLVVMRELKKEDYEGLQKFRRQFKQDNMAPSKAYCAQYSSKPKKHVEEFKLLRGRKGMVRVLMDEEEANRFKKFEELQEAKKSNKAFSEDRATLFQRLDKSKRQSREIRNKVLEMYEQKTIQLK